MSKDPRYPLGVPKDRRHNSTVRAHEAFLVGQGMATAIWDYAYGEPEVEVPAAAYEAAGALLEIYARTNGIDVERLIDRIGFELDPQNDADFEQIGVEMAARAMGRAVRRERFPIDKLAVPQFVAQMDGGDLVWEGDDAPRQNPADLHPNWSGSQVQSLLFDREVFSETRAREWAKRHGYKYGSVDTTERYHRLRQQEPDGRECRTISFGESGIKAVVCAARNPVGDEVRVLSGPDQGRRGRLVEEGRRSVVLEIDGEHIRIPRDETDIGPFRGYSDNPVGDEVDVTSGPGRGRRGVVEHETDRVARVRFAEGGRAHLERSALHTRGRPR